MEELNTAQFVFIDFRKKNNRYKSMQGRSFSNAFQYFVKIFEIYKISGPGVETEDKG